MRRKLINKKIVIPVLVLSTVFAGGVLWSTGRAKAESSTGTTSQTSSVTPETSSTEVDSTSSDSNSFAKKLADKLGVSEDKVQEALDSIKSDRETARQNERNANLDQAVKDGVITADQEQKLKDKFKEEATAKTKEKNDFQQWLKDNGIDLTKLKSYLGKDHHGKSSKS